MSHENVVTTLWTGGWDSTYRVLHLVLERGSTVRPLYLFDKERASSSLELRTMEAIRSELERNHPAAAERLLPTNVVAVESVKDDERIRQMWSRLRLGSQYDWLARYVAAERLDEVEVGAVRGGGGLYALLRGEVEEANGAGGPTLRLKERVSSPDLELFRPFSFPILDHTKPELGRLAERAGFGELMWLTWFCHSPRNNQPCGNCDPCMIALKAGMARRIPVWRRLRPRLRFAKAAIMRHLEQSRV